MVNQQIFTYGIINQMIVFLLTYALEFD